MAKNDKHVLKIEFESTHNPVKADLRTPKYRKRVEQSEKSKQKRRGKKDFDYD